jgi:hypothetical protein
MYFSFRKPPEPEEPIYKKRPLATIAVILSMVGMFVLGPIGAIYKGMSEELKKKADYETVILILKQQKEKDDRQWEEIKNNRNNQQTISLPKNLEVVRPKAIKLMVKKLTPTEYISYMKMSPEQQLAYKKYRTDVTVWP